MDYCTQIRQRLPRCHQPNVVSHVRHDQHIRGVSTTASSIPKPFGPSKWRGRCPDNARWEGVRSQGQRYGVYRLVVTLRLANVRAEYVAKYATRENVDDAGAEASDSDDLSSVGSFGEDDDDEPAGTMVSPSDGCIHSAQTRSLFKRKSRPDERRVPRLPATFLELFST